MTSERNLPISIIFSFFCLTVLILNALIRYLRFSQGNRGLKGDLQDSFNVVNHLGSVRIESIWFINSPKPGNSILAAINEVLVTLNTRFATYGTPRATVASGGTFRTLSMLWIIWEVTKSTRFSV